MYHPEGGALGTSQIRFLSNQETSTFYGSSDDGELFMADWFTRKSEEGGKVDVIKKTWSSHKSFRPTVNLDASPFYEDVLLSVFESSFCIWKTGCADPVFQSPTIDKTFISCGFFSITRPGVVYIGRADGIIDIWDFMDQSSYPTQQHPVVAIGINSMTINIKEPELLAVGDKDGCLHLLKLPSNLIRPAENELASVDEFFGREKDAVEYFKQRFETRIDNFRKAKEEKDKEYDMDDFGNNKGNKHTDNVSLRSQKIQFKFLENFKNID